MRLRTIPHVVTCPACGEVNPERARFCLGCGRTLRAPAAARKTVTVLFADLVRSTQLVEQLDAETARQVVQRYFDTARAVITAHGGTVEKFIGDAVMAVFGVPHVHEDDALRAVRAAAQLRRRLREINADVGRWGIHLQLRTGVNTGEVATGGGTDDSLITGDAVNTAARLEQAAAPGEVLLGPTTYDLVRRAVTATALPPLTLRGKAAPVPAYRLDAVDSRSAPTGRAAPSFVGREPERRLLSWALDRTAAMASCHLVTVLGVAGVGKTRLVTEWLAGPATAAHRPVRVLSGRCLPYGEGITFWPLLEMVRQTVGPVSDSGEARDRLLAVLADTAGAGAVDTVLALVGLAPQDAATVEPDRALRRVLAAMANDRPVVVVLDDLHWAEPNLLDVIERVVADLRTAPVLVVAVARPDLLEQRSTWGGGLRNTTTLDLEPLSSGEATTLLAQLGPSLPAAQAPTLIERAGGNPLFLTELAAAASETGGGPALLPPTVEAVLAARLDRVPRPERDVLDRAAVLGERFTLQHVRELLGDVGGGELEDRVSRLDRRDLVRYDPHADVAAFAHGLVRDAVYATLPRQLRSDLHERTAGLLTDAAGEGGEALEDLAAYHLEQASLRRAELGPLDAAGAALAARAGRALAASGRRAHGHGDVDATSKLLRRSLALLRPDDAQRPLVLSALAKAVIHGGDPDAGACLLREARELANAGGDERALAHIDLQLSWDAEASELDGWDGRAEATARRALAVFEASGDDGGRSQAMAVLAEVAWARGRFAEAERHLTDGLAHARAAGDVREQLEHAAALALASVPGPLPVPDAIERCRRTLAAWEDNRTMHARVLPALALLEAMRGQPQRARELLGEAMGLLTELGQTYWVASTTVSLGRVELLAGDRQAARTALRDGLARLEHLGDLLEVSLAASLLSEAVDDLDDAAAVAGRAREAAPSQDIEAQVQWRLSRSRVDAAGGAADAAVGLADEAVAIAAATDAVGLQAGAWRMLGVAKAARGDAAGATTAWQQALERHERKGDLAGAAVTAALLESAAPVG